MKKFSVIYAAFCLVSSFPLFSQNKTVFHYPLNDGDLWEYEENTGGLRFWEIREVLGDTLLPTGKTYKIIKYSHQRNSEYLRFQRVANNEVYQYTPRFVPPDSVEPDESLVFKLEVAVGDTWPYPIQDVSNKSCFYQVEEIDVHDFANREWKKAWFNVITFSDSSLCAGYIEFLDSLGVYRDTYEGGSLQLRGAIINGKQFGALTSVSERETAPNAHIPIVTSFRIFPNPVVSGTQIQFALNRPDEIQFAIFDILGRELYQSPPRPFGAGLHSLPWRAASGLDKAALSSGVYFLVLNTNLGQQLVRKFTVMK